MLTAVRWVAGSALILFGAYWILAIYVLCLKALLKKWKGSLVPAFGGPIVATGLAVLPLETPRSYWWLPLLIDLGFILTIIAIPWLVYGLISDKCTGSKSEK